MAKTGSCTLVAQRQGTSAVEAGWTAYSTNAAYAGASSSNQYVYLLKFTTPAFKGNSSKITFNLAVGKQSATAGTLRYAVCTSDANKFSYNNTTSAVTDSNALKSGTFSYSGLTSGVNTISFTVATNGLKSEQTYYLFIWGSSSTSDWVTVYAIDSNNWHSISLEYNEGGLVYIANGSSFDAYEVWIANGSKFEQYEVYIGDGTKWVPCG